MKVFDDHIGILAKCFNTVFENMTNFHASGLRVAQKEWPTATFAVGQAMPFEISEKKENGEFVLGFADKEMAVFIASMIAGNMGLPPVTSFGETASDILGEFLNIMAGGVLQEWDKIESEVRFGSPVQVKNKSLATASGPSPGTFQITLEFPSKQVVQDRSFDHVILNVAYTRSEGEQKEAKRILVADDSAMMRNVFTNALKGVGFVVEQARDGLDAVEKHGEFHPDLTVMDLTMPRMGGLDAILKIREADPNARFLVVTATSRRDEVVTAQSLSLEGYVVKGAGVEDFISKVQGVFK